MEWCLAGNNYKGVAVKLTHAQIRRYRSIDEQTEFDVDEDVTCLVGKNESGKTAALQALYKSHSVDRQSFDPNLDYPSRKAREIQKREPVQATALTYRLEKADVQAVEDVLGPNALRKHEITVKNGYEYKMPTWSIDVDESAVLATLRSGLDLPSSACEAAGKASTVAELVDVLENIGSVLPTSDTVLRKVKSWRDFKPKLAAIDILAERRPKFVYFGEYDIIPGKVSVPDLSRRQDDQDLTRGEEALLGLLSMAGVSLEDLSSVTNHERFIRQIENASNAIGDDIFEYWTQNKNLEVDLKLLPTAEPNALPQLTQAPLLEIRVRNTRHRVSVPFDERSRGFVWFFSFLAYFSKLEEDEKLPLILLLDEPGLSLHAMAQRDLLRFIEERLAPDHQVIYTTHSPFMVDPQRFDRVRTVVDDQITGTTVSDEVLRTDKESAFPLHAALGVELTQTLFVGPEVLFVEGPSDVIYLQYLSDQLKQAGREGLDERWVIVPGGGITKLPAFLTLFGANNMTIAVLTDSATDNSHVITELKKSGKLYEARIVQIGDVLNRDEADIEDLLDPSFYLDLVNEAYQGVLKGQSLSEDELPEGERIVKRVEDFFKKRGLNNGRINHYAPAGVLNRHANELWKEQTKLFLGPAEELIKRINGFLEKNNTR